MWDASQFFCCRDQRCIVFYAHEVHSKCRRLLFFERFMGVYHRPRKEVHIFSKEKHGTKAATTQIIPWGDASLEKMIPRDLFAQLEVNRVISSSSNI